MFLKVSKKFKNIHLTLKRGVRMIKKEGAEQKSNLYILAIVGIVAMVGIVVLLSNTGMTGTSDFSGAAITSSMCIDKDGGLDYETRGIMYGGTWRTSNLTYKMKEDSCDVNGKLREYYCSSSTVGDYKTVDCTMIGEGVPCYDGTCPAEVS